GLFVKVHSLGELPMYVSPAQPANLTGTESDLVVGFCGTQAHGRPMAKFFSEWGDPALEAWEYEYFDPLTLVPPRNIPQGRLEAQCVEARAAGVDMTSCFTGKFKGRVTGNVLVRDEPFENASLTSGRMFFSSVMTPTSGPHAGRHYLCCSNTCGNGCVEPDGADNALGNADDEECDNDVNNNSNAPNQPCRVNCKNRKCGDGIVDDAFTEVCDDGNTSNTDACLNTCVAAICGDGFVRSGVEVCDDGPKNGQAGFCNTTCGGPTPSACGNGVVEAGEQCDDGNTSNTDACLNSCVSAACGDGFVRTGTEECDDGNTVPTDGCTHPLCRINLCGDGIVKLTDDNSDGEPDQPCDIGPGLACKLSGNECQSGADCAAGEQCGGPPYNACTSSCNFNPGWGCGLCVYPPSESSQPVRSCRCGFGGPSQGAAGGGAGSPTP
ncbi:MAG: DUF4215 domain-containing protein, partial [Patescibacteria group bacterium]